MTSRSYFFLFWFLIALKMTLVPLIVYIGYDFFGGGNDSDYYDSYARGEVDELTSVWPVLLRFLNDLGLYSRDGVRGFLMFLGILVIPFWVGRLAVVKNSGIETKIFWISAFAISAYPTVFYYTFDIYRDVFMVWVFLIALFLFKSFLYEERYFKKLFLFGLGVAVAYFLYLLRPYLGFGVFFALVGSVFFSFKRYPLGFSIFLLLFSLNIFFYIGLLDPLLAYRDIFSEQLEGGTNLGISFSSGETFLIDFIKSFMLQMLGLYLKSPSSVFVFVLESLPFMIAFFYLIKNRDYSDYFVDYLVVFFVIYSTIWIIGNDNLGTAVRLRIPSYISIFIACMIVYQNKLIFKSNAAKSLV